jgi:hypothetical protein
MFARHIVTPEALAARFLELLPEYLPGVDTGAFEATDRRRCWNKTLNGVLTAIGNELGDLQVVTQSPTITLFKDQSSLMWQRDQAPVFVMATGWGSRDELETSLERLEAFKCPQKLFIYSCSKWREAVHDQIEGILLRYPYHIQGEQYIFMNLIGAENRFDLAVADVGQSSHQVLQHDRLVKPVSGSPFGWTTKPKVS